MLEYLSGVQGIASDLKMLRPLPCPYDLLIVPKSTYNMTEIDLPFHQLYDHSALQTIFQGRLLCTDKMFENLKV